MQSVDIVTFYDVAQNINQELSCFTHMLCTSKVYFKFYFLILKIEAIYRSPVCFSVSGSCNELWQVLVLYNQPK